MLLVHAGAASVRLHRRVGLRPSRLQRAFWGFLARALHPAEKSRLAVEIYQTSEYQQLRGLTWEVEWFASWLPRPPARLLVGGCGAGSEVLHLLERGYEVVAFDPATRLVELCRGNVAGRAEILELSYEDLSRVVLDGSDRYPELSRSRFDGVLLGLASINHVLVAEERARLFRALETLCPEGPILTSFLKHRPHKRRRAVRLGEAAGSWLGQARGVRRSPDEEYEMVVDGLGFHHGLASEEVRRLASILDRDVTIEEAPDNGTLAAFVKHTPRLRSASPR